MSKNIEDVIEDENVELHDMSKEEITVLVKALSVEGLKLRANRKSIRYRLYRCRTEAEGKCASGCDDEFKAIFEKQKGFTGWRFFAINWDVDFLEPDIIVSRDFSEIEEWERVVASKFPVIMPGGKIVYPDIRVKRKIELEIASREEQAESIRKKE